MWGARRYNFAVLGTLPRRHISAARKNIAASASENFVTGKIMCLHFRFLLEDKCELHLLSCLCGIWGTERVQPLTEKTNEGLKMTNYSEAVTLTGVFIELL